MVVVLATSQGHFDESLDAIASVQNVLPNHRILYYDIDPERLTRKQIFMVSWLPYVYNSYKLL